MQDCCVRTGYHLAGDFNCDFSKGSKRSPNFWTGYLKGSKLFIQDYLPPHAHSLAQLTTVQGESKKSFSKTCR